MTTKDRQGWLKSSFCGTGNCVEVLFVPAGGGVAVRDSKDRSQSPLVFTPAAWVAFLTGARAGEFDVI